MRKLQFRAWNPLAKLFFYGHAAFIYHGDNGLEAKVTWKGEPVDQEVQQFTGLCDRNGKEIYEGDILKYSKYVDHGQWGETVDGGTVQVTWSEERAGFYPFCVWSSYNDQLKTCEVIGNIYENPELLTK